jgi:uncharacterized protein (DUF983 family)
MNIISPKKIKHCPLCLDGEVLESLGEGVLRCKNCNNAFRVHHPPQKPPFINPNDQFPMFLKQPKDD